MIKLSIVIVAYNGLSYLKKCLISLRENKIPHMEIIIIDNASIEKGLEKMLSQFPDIILIKNNKNLGFAKGVNIGLKNAKGEYVLILNPDTIILPDTFTYILQKMDEDISIVLAGCKIVNEKKQLLQSAGYRFPNIFSHIYEYNYPFYRLLKIIFPNYHPLLYSKKQHEKEMNVKHLMGAFLLLRKSIFQKIDKFDERYFLYREETDFCKKIIENGFNIAYLPQKGGIIHIGGRSSSIRITQTSPFYMKSTYIFFKKYHSLLYVFIAYLLGLLSSFISFIFASIKSLVMKTRNKEYTQKERQAWKTAFIWHVTHLSYD